MKRNPLKYIAQKMMTLCLFVCIRVCVCVGACVCSVGLSLSGWRPAGHHCHNCLQWELLRMLRATARGGGIGRRDSWIDHFSSNIQYCGNLYFFAGFQDILSFSDTSGLENPFRSPTSLSYSSEISGVFTFRQYFGVFIFKNFDIFRDSNF